MADNDRIANLFGGDPGPEPEDRVDEMFGSLTEQSPGVFTSPVGLNAEEMTTLGDRLTAQMNQVAAANEERPSQFTEDGYGPYPHPDPRFPDRPDHPDFWKLSEIINHFDDLADKGMDLMDVAILKGLDLKSLVYMAKQRALRALDTYKDTEAYPEGSTNEETRVAASWLDGFMAGQDFGEDRAKRNEPRIVLGDAQHRAREDRHE